MKNILVTGSSGFIGRNLINRITLSSDFSVYVTNKDINAIFPCIPSKLDYLIHLAAVHRGVSEDEIYKENMTINKKLINLLKVNNLESNIVFTSSIQELNNSAYGNSKKDGAKFFKETCKSWNKEFIKIKLPNVFGPNAKPYQTSVIANFCQDIISNKESFVNEVEINLLFIQQAINSILKFETCENFQTNKVYLPDVYAKLKSMYKSYLANTRIELNNKFEVQLFNTLISYINE